MKISSLAVALTPILLAAPSFAQREFRIGLPGVGDFPAYEAVQPAFQNPDETKRTAGLAATLQPWLMTAPRPRASRSRSSSKPPMSR